MGWDLEQFNQMCISKNLSDSKNYQKALLWKKEKVAFLVLQSENVWNDFYQTKNSSTNAADILCQILNDEQVSDAFKTARFQSETYIEAAAQNLHSMADILCQIINKAILNSEIDEAKVTIGETIKELNKEENTQDIVNALENLRNSQEFKYIAAFVNTIKHRSLLDTDYSGEFGSGKNNIMRLRFLSFNYGKLGNPADNYNNTFAETIANDYKERIFDLIDGVGRATNTYIRYNK